MAAVPLTASASWLGICPVRSASSSCATSSSVAAFAMAACNSWHTLFVTASPPKHLLFAHRECIVQLHHLIRLGCTCNGSLQQLSLDAFLAALGQTSELLRLLSRLAACKQPPT